MVVATRHVKAVRRLRPGLPPATAVVAVLLATVQRPGGGGASTTAEAAGGAGRGCDVTDDARRVLTEEERARIQEAKRNGRLCALCGRALAEGETIWVEWITIHGGHGDVSRWRAPVGVECASPAFRTATEGGQPERCAGCGRGVYYQSAHWRRRLVLCSRRWAGRVTRSRLKEARGS